MCVRKLGKNVFIEDEEIKSDTYVQFLHKTLPSGPILDFVYYIDLNRARGFYKTKQVIA